MGRKASRHTHDTPRVEKSKILIWVARFIRCALNQEKTLYSDLGSLDGGGGGGKQDRLHGHGVRRGNPAFLERVPAAGRSAEDRPHDGEIRGALLLAGKVWQETQG